MKYMIIAGEASGDLHASRLIRALRAEDPACEIRFFGGDLMAAEAGRAPDLHYDRLNVMGFSEVLRHLPQIFRNLRLAKTIMRDFRPDIFIPVDFPGFNLRLAKFAHSLGVKVDWYISPKLWAWKEWRIKKIRKYVDNLYSILPFEPDWYRRRDYSRCSYVGNPSVEEIDLMMKHIAPLRHFMERQGISDPRPIIALLPGSRRGEIRNNLPLMLEAARKYPEFQYIVGAASAIPERFYREVAQDPGLKVVFGATTTLVKYARAALVTSGTATLETALVGTPQVVCYRANGKRWSYRIMEKLLKVKYVSLPNLIVGNGIVPELLVHRCTVANINRELTPLLQPSPKRDWQINGYRMMRRKLGTSDAASYAARLICSDAGIAIGPAPAPAEERKPGRRSARRPSRRPSEELPGAEERPNSEERPTRNERRRPKPQARPQNAKGQETNLKNQQPKPQREPNQQTKPQKAQNQLQNPKDQPQKSKDQPQRPKNRPQNPKNQSAAQQSFHEPKPDQQPRREYHHRRRKRNGQQRRQQSES